MWNERQRAQGVEIELARIKRELADQDRELAELMADHYVTHAELDALDARDRDEAPTSTETVRTANFRDQFIVRG